MKKYILLYTIISTCLTIGLNAQQQEKSLRDRLEARRQQEQKQQQNAPQLSVRAEQKNREMGQDLTSATWTREVYRFLDLNKGTNAALYHPVQPVNGRTNLYTTIFRLMASGNLPCYQYLDGREAFTDDYKESFKDILERLEIPFEQNGNIFTVNEFDIPANEVLGYYVKEAWYFDQTQSKVDVKTIAICPVVFRQDDYGIGADRFPQGWILYDDLRPYLSRMPIITSDLNNVMNKTIDDYFRQHLFDGEIYKTGNMENKLLSEIYPDPQALKEAQDRIENELRAFNKNLWVTSDSSYIKPDGTKKKKQKNQSSSSSSALYSARDRRK